MGFWFYADEKIFSASQITAANMSANQNTSSKAIFETDALRASSSSLIRSKQLWMTLIDWQRHQISIKLELINIDHISNIRFIKIARRLLKIDSSPSQVKISNSQYIECLKMNNFGPICLARNSKKNDVIFSIFLFVTFRNVTLLPFFFCFLSKYQGYPLNE